MLKTSQNHSGSNAVEFNLARWLLVSAGIVFVCFKDCFYMLVLFMFAGCTVHDTFQCHSMNIQVVEIRGTPLASGNVASL